MLRYAYDRCVAFNPSRDKTPSHWVRRGSSSTRMNVFILLRSLDSTQGHCAVGAANWERKNSGRVSVDDCRLQVLEVPQGKMPPKKLW